MSYAQWMTLSVLPTGFDVTLKNFQHSWGKFYINDKDDEKSPGSLNGSLAQDGGDFTFGACGREDASSGTTGSVDLFDGHINIGTYSASVMITIIPVMLIFAVFQRWFIAGMTMGALKH